MNGCEICNAGYEFIFYAKTNDPKEKGEYKRREVKYCPNCGAKIKGGESDD